MSLNYIVLSGTLAADSEVRYTVSGKAVLEFMLRPEDGQSDEFQPQVRVISAREQALEKQSQLKKGQAVLVEGQLYQRKVDSGAASRRKQPEINMDHLTLLK